MSDIIVLDNNTALAAADLAGSNATIAVDDLDTLLGGLPDVIASLPEIVADLVDHIAVSVLPSLDLGVLDGLDELLGDLPGALDHLLDITPGLAGGTLLGLGNHADGTVDVATDQGLGLTAGLTPLLDPVANLVNDITMSLGVTDELPARLSALTGIAILGSDSIVHNVAGILDASLGLDLEPTLNAVVGSLGLAVDELTVSLGLGHVLGVLDVGLNDGPVTVQDTADQSGDASGSLLGSLFGDADGLGDSQSDNSLVVAVHGLTTGVPADVQSVTGLILTDTLDTTVPSVVDHVSVGLGSLLVDPTTLGVGNLLTDPTAVGVGNLLDPTSGGSGLGVDVDQTVTGVTDLLDNTTTGLGLDLHLGGLG